MMDTEREDPPACQHFGEPVPDACGTLCKVARPADADRFCLGFPDSPEECYRWQRERADDVDTSLLTAADRVRLVQEADSEIGAGNVDQQFVLFVRRINAIPWLVTTQCCQGHILYPNSSSRKCAYVSLRVRPQGLQRLLEAIARYQVACERLQELGWTQFEVDTNTDGSRYLRFCLYWREPEETEERMRLFCEALATVRGV
jgi:hypothetical protein